ncbi:MAG: HAD family hydrolase [Campylobacter sp.]|nr:HAD family hydrolase [Campylobacter sp.]
MKLVIFDMDGTLIDSGDAITKTVNNMRFKVGLEPNLQTDFIVEVINKPGVSYVEMFYPGVEISPDLAQEFEREFAENYAKAAVAYEDIHTLLKNLKDIGVYISLATNGPADNATKTLSKVGVLDCFDYVIGANDKIPKKPDPTMLLESISTLKAMSGLDYDKSKDLIYFVGDSLKDEKAAINAGIDYLQVTWGFGKNSLKFPNFNSTKELFKHIKDSFYQS